MSEDKPTEPIEPTEPVESVTPSEPVEPVQPTPSDPYDYFGGFNAADALREARKKAKDDAGGDVSITASDIKAGLAEIPATFKDLRKRRRYTGGQWFLSFAFLFSAWVGFSGEGGFNLLAFLIMFGILWLVSAPFRVAGWAVRRANSRPCSVCGIRIPNGETQCQSCGTDFTIR